MLFRFLFIALLAGSLFWACSEKAGRSSEEVAFQGSEADRKRIDSLEKIIVRHTGKEADKELPQVLETLRAYQNYTIDYPKDTASAEYLLKAGNIYYSYLKDYENAEEHLNRLVDSFPKARQRPVGLLLLGNTYHDMGDTARAIAALHILQREYSQSEYHRMAQELIAYIRRTSAGRPPATDQPQGPEPKI